MVGMVVCILVVLGCGRAPGSPVLEGRKGQWLTDGTLGVKATEFHESLGGMGGPFGVGGGVSLGMTCEAGNRYSSDRRRDIESCLSL